MTLTVIKGGFPLTDDEKQKIKDIFANSKCVNESLINTFGDAMLVDGKLYIGTGISAYTDTQEIEVADNEL